jgi:AhpD family alkylhydroperoxidase
MATRPQKRDRRSPRSARFHPLAPYEAEGKAGELLHELAGRHGPLGSMVATMAHSPSVLAAYLDFSRAMKRASLDRRISERVSIAVQAQLGCQTCLDAHTDAARRIGVDDDEIEAARSGRSVDSRAAAVLDFALKVFAQPASVDDDDVVGLLAYGYSEREILDVVGVVALNQLTGSFNLVAGL